MKDVHEVLKNWPNFDVIASDCDTSKDNVWQWVKRGFIPPTHLTSLVSSAKKRGIKKISYEFLAPLTIKPTE